MGDGDSRCVPIHLARKSWKVGILNDPVLVAIIAAVPVTLMQLCNLIIAFMNRKKIEQIHQQTNSMHDAIVESTRKVALQEGHAAGVKDEKDAGALLKEKL